MEADIQARVSHASSYLLSTIGESIDNLGKGEFMGMIRSQEKATIKKAKEDAEKAEKEKAEKAEAEKAEKATAEKTASEGRSWASRILG